MPLNNRDLNEGSSLMGQSIIGIENMTMTELKDEIERGGKFVYYQYCYSLLILTKRESSPIYFVKKEESSLVKGLKYTLSSFLFGWWGVPWGLIYTPICIVKNLLGGKNITDQVMIALTQES